jgi:aspartate aminotransferase
MPSLIPALAAKDTLMTFLNDPEVYAMMRDPDVANFAVGNPQEPPLPALVDALIESHKSLKDKADKDAFAYKMNEPSSRQALAEILGARLGLNFQPEDFFLTHGAFGAIATAIRALAGPGDEVVFVSPPWFGYEPMILATGADLVRATAEGPAWDLPVDAIAAAITARTTVVIITTPHNPSGRLYPAEQLQRLADVLTAASEKYGHPIYLFSDEAYYRIVFDDRKFISPASMYPATLIMYSYGKTTLAPGMRMGYIALAPGMPDVEQLRKTLEIAQVVTGYCFPNADLQSILPKLEEIIIDVPAMQARRDRLVPALREMGYDATMPEGTFYILVKSPIPDDQEFARILRGLGVLVLPGALAEVPGYIRLSLTANEEMVERGIERFRKALAQASPAA